MAGRAELIARHNMLHLQDHLVRVINEIRTCQKNLDEALDLLSDCDLSGIDEIDSVTAFDVRAYSASNSLAEMNRLLCGWLQVVAQEAVKYGPLNAELTDW